MSDPAPNSPNEHSYDIIIVGAGMTGCALAKALHRAAGSRPRRILIFDIHPGVSPRFAGEFIHPRGAQVLDDLGFYPALKKAGAVDVNGFVVLESAQSTPTPLDYADLRGERPQGISVHHKTLVRVMRKEIQNLPGVDLHEGWKLTELLRAEDGTVNGVVVRDDKRQLQRIRAGLVVGADGKNSTTRKLAKIESHTNNLGFTAGIEIENASNPAPLHANVFVGAVGPVLCYPIVRKPDGKVISRMTFDLPSEIPVKRKELKDFLLRSFVPFLPPQLGVEVALRLESQQEELEMAAVVELRLPNTIYPRGMTLVGDAAGCSHPITASGMTMGLLDAHYLGEEAARRSQADINAPWLDPRSLHRFQNRHDRYVPTRQALASAIYEAFIGNDEGSRSIRRALFRYWKQSPRNRQRSLGLLACAEGRSRIFLSEYMRTAGHALGSSLSPQYAEYFPVADRLRQIRGTIDQAGDKLGLVAQVAWVNFRPDWFPRALPPIRNRVRPS